MCPFCFATVGLVVAGTVSTGGLAALAVQVSRKKNQEPETTVSPQEWEAARQQLLVKEKAFTRSRDALAAERRRMPWLLVEKQYEFEGPKGKVNLLDLFEGRRQLIVYRAFFEPGVFGWPDHACRGCSFGADQVSHLAHLNARDTTLAWASRAPQADIARLKARMGWEMPWYTMIDAFDKDFGVDEWRGHNVFFRDGDKVFRSPIFTGTKMTNTATYLAGGRDFGPIGSVPHLYSRNLTPDKTGLPEGGRTYEQFVEIMRQGTDLDHIHPNCTAPGTPANCFLPPFNGDLLQVMRWPAFQNMTDHQLQAIYEYLSAIPCNPGPVIAGAEYLQNTCE